MKPRTLPIIRSGPFAGEPMTVDKEDEALLRADDRRVHQRAADARARDRRRAEAGRYIPTAAEDFLAQHLQERFGGIYVEPTAADVLTVLPMRSCAMSVQQVIDALNAHGAETFGSDLNATFGEWGGRAAVVVEVRRNAWALGDPFYQPAADNRPLPF